MTSWLFQSAKFLLILPITLHFTGQEIYEYSGGIRFRLVTLIELVH